MGGYGSGRQGNRSTVEDCLSVDTNSLARWGYLKPGLRIGNLRWSRGDNETGSCGFYIKSDDASHYIVFTYAYDGGELQDHKVELSWYSPGFGGRRYLFLCPYCNRRMRTLHILQGQIACRICHDLTYTSCNESHKYDRIHQLIAAGLMQDGIQASGKDVKRWFSARIRENRKEPKRPRGRPRKNKA